MTLVGDVITAIGGKDVSVLDDQGVYAFIGLSAIGSTVHVSVRRGNATQSFDMVTDGPWTSGTSTSP